jgi:catechol 2,3-dioxygenase-like lactoylglutathione lyase family enzyme
MRPPVRPTMRPPEEENEMDIKIELVQVPVTDVDRAKGFYVDSLGFTADFDEVVNEQLRFVQLTPPGSACSIVMGVGIGDMEPGTQRGLLAVIADADAVHAELTAKGVEVSPVADLAWGRFIYFADPDGNTWALQQLPVRAP